jgi:hypothetical protein
VQDQHPFWKFAENPFTWGGIGVVIGAALASPASFRIAFIVGGFAVGVGLLRANSFNTKATWKRIIGNLVLYGLLACIWILLWKIIPKTVEPPTVDQIAEAIVKKQGYQTGNNKPESVQTATASQIADAVLKKLPKEQGGASGAGQMPTPEETLHRMSNRQLREYTVSVANSMRDFETKYYPRVASSPTTNDPTDRQQQFFMREQEYQNQERTYENEFKKQLWGKSYTLRDELLGRLKQAGITPPSLALGPQSQAKMVLDEGRLNGPGPIGNAANYLELLARALP